MWEGIRGTHTSLDCLETCGQLLLPLNFSCCNQAFWGLSSKKDLQPFTAGGSQIQLRYAPEWLSKILARPQTLYFSVFSEGLQFKAKRGGDCILRATFISYQSALVLLAMDKVSSCLAIEALSKDKVMKYNLKVWPNSTELMKKSFFHFKWI